MTGRATRRSSHAASGSGEAYPSADDGYHQQHSTTRPTRSTRAAASSAPDYGEEDGDFEPDADGDADMGEDDADFAAEEAEDEEAPQARPSRNKKNVIAIEDDEEDEVEEPVQVSRIKSVSLHGRTVTRPAMYEEPSTEEDDKPKKKGRITRGSGGRRASNDFVDDEDDDQAGDYGYGTRRSTRRQSYKNGKKKGGKGRRASEGSNYGASGRSTRRQRAVDDSFEVEGSEQDTEESDDEPDLHDEDDDIIIAGGPRRLREKAKVDYYAIPPLEAPPEKSRKGKGKQRANDPFGGLPANLTGAQWAALYPEKGGQPDSSDSDDDVNLAPRNAPLFGSKSATAAAGLGGGEGGMFAGGGGIDMAGAGAPNNLGKVSKATLADVDPLGVSSNISFDSVGGLQGHIQQLKEMVSLPLLYPEVFERFNITPPRGVLFHGPPGTGKTLLARALAASCSTEGRKISFFMRKGADVLSKWVGEAERQLRLLFEEAKNCQPSIIFFDEIDGLAPVRSSKQEQIHASIVSTLLALMDGMDGRGQVIVIGATNRPDAIDPALRRPGRFDREFYFPLPNLEGRRKIIDIHTSGWEPPIESSFKDELAGLTKGYGGADLRALCTEAALNAVQRTYPQIYKTNDRLVIEPKHIDVTARDFVLSQKNLIPSTARATSSAAAPIPPQLEPLLHPAFEAAKLALAKILPEVKKHNVLEEAEWEDEGGGFEKEKMIQAFETLRVFRPRMLICGETGMGQTYVGAAVLHHLEGFHVQLLDLATLVADSSRTMEAACVQLFVEAKRHKPSILFIPSLITWCNSVNETVKSTIKGLIDGLDPSDPILLMAVVDGPLSDIPGDVRSWFGFVKGNRVVMTQPSADQRHAFFADVIAGVRRPPNEFPDAMPRRKRVLEKLAIAPPPPPREPTAAEIQAQEMSDQRLMEYVKWRLGPVLAELKKRYKRFTRSYYTDWRNDDFNFREEQLRNGEEVLGLGVQPYHNVDLDSMHLDLYNGVYHTPSEFLEDILRIQVNASINAHLEHDAEGKIKAGQMTNHANVMLDQTFDQAFKGECEKMAERVKKRVGVAGVKQSKGKGKKVDQAEDAITAAAQAGGARRYETRSRQAGPDDPPFEVQDIGALERQAKRLRREEDEETQVQSQSQGEDGQGPSKRLKASNGDVEEGALAAVQSRSVSIIEETASSSASLEGANGQSNGGGSSLADLLNPNPLPHPSALPPLPSLPTGDLLNGSALPPLPSLSGALGSDVVAQGASAQLVDPTLASAVAGPSTAAMEPEASTASNGTGGHVRFVEAVLAAASSTAADVEATTSIAPIAEAEPAAGLFVNGNTAPQAVPSSPIAVDPPTPEPLPDFDLSSADVTELANFLAERTGPLTIDQLEQLRAACYDVIWRGRRDWNRAEMVRELKELAAGFVEEVVECNGGGGDDY